MKDIIEFTQFPIGRLNDSYAFCHHGGWYECDMQTHQLCSKQMTNSSWDMFDFVECNFANQGVHDATNTQLCAAKASLDVDKLWACATGYGATSGPHLLIASITEAQKRGVHSAPNVFLEGKNVGNTITLKQICDAYTGTKPAACTEEDVPLVATGETCAV